MPKKHTILIVDDEKNTRDGLSWSLEGEQYDCLTAEDGKPAMDILQAREVDLVLTDLKMPGMDGMTLMRKVREEFPTTEVIILTGHGTVESAVEAMKEGAFHYLIKPVNLDELSQTVSRALKQHDLQAENKELREQLSERHGFENIVGQSEAMRRVFERVEQVAPTRASVLLVGESGTGKEVIAGAIHHNSNRKTKRFIKLNCGALTTTLLESELFGHEAGAFTDARRQKIGRFEMADGGTLFLDEITETAPEFQVKLLRVLQEQEFERVGGTQTISVDVRVIAATNQDIEKAVEEGRFREDLYYRLNVVKIEVPPLRERRDDIPLLVDTFLEEICEQNDKPKMPIAPKALDALSNYGWPGNVRQLRNVIEGMVVLSTGKELSLKNLPEEIRSAEAPKKSLQLSVGASLEDMERELIRATLDETEGNRAAAARILGVGRKTLYRKLEQYGLS
ncbi:MAG: sigma-54-dependent transcriptional regulator [Candidatus Sumerlaeota bacterium]